MTCSLVTSLQVLIGLGSTSLSNVLQALGEWIHQKPNQSSYSTIERTKTSRGTTKLDENTNSRSSQSQALLMGWVCVEQGSERGMREVAASSKLYEEEKKEEMVDSHAMSHHAIAFNSTTNL